MEAAKAFERERYKDADRHLKQLVDQAPEVPAVRELYGLNLYRLPIQEVRFVTPLLDRGDSRRH